jgi:spermidine synthase
LAVANVFLRAILVLGLPTFLMGMAFPVAARLCVPRLDRVGSGTGRLYAVNTIGSILGSFASGFVLIPLFGLARGFLVLALINVAIGSLVLLINPADSRRFKIVWTVVSFFALIVLAARVPGEYRFQALGSPLHRFVAYEEGPLATVSVVEDSVGDRTIFVDNVGVAGTDRILLTDQKSLAHVPMLLLENPRSALTVGFGSGGASWSFLQYKELERVDCIEICDTVPAMARYLRASNHGVLDAWDGGNPTGQRFHDGRYRIIVDDVRSYLRFADMKYDVIATDCTDFRYKSNANLYDVEYFELCRDAITDDGMVVVWMPLGGMSPGVFACAMKTFAHVFPDMTIWYMNNEPTHYLLLLGTKKPLRVNLSRMLERVSRPEIQADLREVSLHQAERVLACYVDVATTFEEDWSEAPLNTETRPHLEFESPKYGYGEEPLLVNLDGLRKRKARVSTSDYLEDAAAHPEFMKRLTRFEDANDSILAGHSFVRRLERKNANEALLAACRHYIEALRIAPEDESVQFLLTFDTLRRRSDLWALTLLGEIMRAQGRHDAAANLHHRAVIQAQNQIAQLEAVAARLPLDSPELDENRSMVSRDLYFMRKAVVGLARAYADLGRVDRALQTLAEHELLLDQDADAAALRAEINAGYKAKEVAP